MAEQVNKEQTKDAKQEKITGLSDEQLAEAQGGAATRSLPGIKVHRDDDSKGDFDEVVLTGETRDIGG